MLCIANFHHHTGWLVGQIKVFFKLQQGIPSFENSTHGWFHPEFQQCIRNNDSTFSKNGKEQHEDPCLRTNPTGNAFDTIEQLKLRSLHCCVKMLSKSIFCGHSLQFLV